MPTAWFINHKVNVVDLRFVIVKASFRGTLNEGTLIGLIRIFFNFLIAFEIEIMQINCLSSSSCPWFINRKSTLPFFTFKTHCLPFAEKSLDPLRTVGIAAFISTNRPTLLSGQTLSNHRLHNDPTRKLTFKPQKHFRIQQQTSLNAELKDCVQFLGRLCGSSNIAKLSFQWSTIARILSEECAIRLTKSITTTFWKCVRKVAARLAGLQKFNFLGVKA